MQESTTVSTAKPLEMGCIEDRDVITTEGRNIGTLKGAWLDLSTWTVTSLVVQLNKDVVDELNVKKPALRSAVVNIPTTYVKNVSDVMQLNTDMTALSTALSTAGTK